MRYEIAGKVVKWVTKFSSFLNKINEDSFD